MWGFGEGTFKKCTLEHRSTNRGPVAYMSLYNMA